MPRDGIVDRVAAAETSLSRAQVAAAVDAVAGNHAGLRCLADAFAADADALAHGAPPVVGKLVTELGRARLEGSDHCGVRGSAVEAVSR